MKYLPLLSALGLVLLPGLGRAQDSATPQPLMVECEDFQFKASWLDDSDQAGASETNYLRLGAPDNNDALTEIQVPVAGHYKVWTRSFDFAKRQPGTRRYRLAVDNVPMDLESGGHKQDGWRWEPVGAVDLAAGLHVLSLRQGVVWSRSDAILLAPDTFNPDKVLPIAKMQPYRIHPTSVALSPAKADTGALSGLAEAASLESATTRIVFQQGKDTTGAPHVVRQVFSRDTPQGPWKAVPFDGAGESLFYLFSPAAQIDTHDYLPTWPTAKPVTFTLDGKEYRAGDGHNPYLSGEQVALSAVSARLAAPGKVEVRYTNAAGVEAVGTWSLEKEAQGFAVSFPAPQAGFYSIGFSPFQGWDRDGIDYVQLPPLFQRQRLPSSPVFLQSAMTPHPLALVQHSVEKAPFTYIAAADPDKFPFEWGTLRNSPYGFSILNATLQVQPTVFAPVLGLPNSKFDAGQSVAASFVAIAEPGDWKKGLEDESNDVFKVTDYRQPNYGSLTDAALNMIDLLKDQKVSGWDPRLKGPYNIESENTAVQCSPESYFSTALLTRDAAFYDSRALPSLEFTLSRPGSSYAPEMPDPPSPYLGNGSTTLAFPGRYFGARYWHGVYELTLRANPWLKALATTPDGKVRRNYGHYISLWSEMIGSYQLDPTPEKLAALKAEADAWIASDVYGRDTKPQGIMPFYNFMGPFWWDLVDLYDLTGDKKYLDAAEEGAFHTIAGVWNHPKVPAGNVTANQAAQFIGNPKFGCWKGEEKIPGDRLGFPPSQAKEAQVPAWEVAQMGITLEQPLTYVIGGAVADGVSGAGGLNNILNCPWSPYLLRLYQYTGREIYKTYARNAIIGRFSNYGGYGLLGLTDVNLKPDFPTKVEVLYYQHIPVHLAFTIDYLFTEAGLASGGKIAFPWVKQQDYFWLQTRQYGFAPGKVYDDAGMWPWLDRAAFTVPSPQINYFGALGNGVFDVVVTNTSNSNADTSLHLNLDKTGVKGGDRYEFLKDGKVVSGGTVSPDVAFTLAPRVTAVLRFHTAKDGGFPALKPLETKPVQLPLPAPWKEADAMRLRSPFGTDSVFAFVATPPAKGTEIQLVYDDSDQAPLTVKEPPYEFSIHNLAMDQTVSFHLVLKAPDGTTTESPKVTLAGTH